LNEEYKIIGDTGWMDLKNLDNQPIDYKQHEWNHINNWDWVFEQNKKWVSYVQECINKYDKLIVVTHHPMYFPTWEQIKSSRLKNKGNDEILFWYFNAKLEIPKDKKVLFIHGHTHTEAFVENHYTNAIGRGSERKELAVKTLEI
jgi:hypothetical protein